MYSGLSAETTRIELLVDVGMASQHGNWYWMIKQLKNYSLHDSLISSQILELVPNLRPE